MSDYWQMKFDEHRVHEKLRDTIEIIKNLLDDENNSQAKTILQYLLSMLIALQKAITNMNPADAVNTDTLDYIYKIADASNNSFAFYKVDKDINELKRARDEKYKCLTNYLRIINENGNKSILNNLKEVFQIVNGIESDKIETELENIDLSEKFKEQEEKLQKLSGMTEGRIDEINKELNKIINDFNDKISWYDTEAKGEQEKLKRLHGIVAGEGFTGSYSKISTKEESSADNWRSCSVVCIVCLILGSLYATSLPIEPEKSLVFIGQFIKTFSIAAAFIYGAVFSIRQSNQHRKNANRAKWLATGINAIESFTGTLDETKRSEVRLKMIEIILSQQEGGGSAESNPWQDDIMERLRAIIDLLKAKP